MDDLLSEFLAESSENLERLELALVDLERDPDDAELLGDVFRTVHTIKGTCGFLGLARLESVAHSAENVLGALRDGALRGGDEVFDDILAAVDVIKEILQALGSSGAEPPGDDTGLVTRLDAWLSGGESGGTDQDDLDALFAAAAAAARPSSEPVGNGTGNGSGPEARAPATPPAERPATTGDSTLRVPIAVLDRLMNLAGELVLTRNQLSRLAPPGDDSGWVRPIQQLSRVTGDLQEAVMKTRMQPVGNAWSKLPRLVRDLASYSGKEIDLEFQGGDTELDRQILEAVRDPLVHMVRNSADHGIEAPEERHEAGKPTRGRIVLRAYQQGGQIVIEVRDDGQGLNVGRIREKVVARRLLTEEEVRALPDHRVAEFIFEPGFSTASVVTSVSGRGVGMDVVRSSIERVGGTIDVSTSPGQGTTFRLKIPLTLAIMPALIVHARGHRFAIPQIGVREILRLEEGGDRNVDRIKGAWFYRLRESLVPLTHLGGLLELDEAGGLDGRNVVVCQAGASRFGLVVDRIVDTQEIVVKPVGRMVQQIQAYAGATILGDGSVIMILDLSGLAAKANLLVRAQGAEAGEEGAEPVERPVRRSGSAVLLFEAGNGPLRGVHLDRVARLEEFPARAIERADGGWLVQYREGLMPLVTGAPEMDPRNGELRTVVVLNHGTTRFGIAVDRLHDIVEEEIAVQPAVRTPGLLGTAVVAGRTVELVDVDAWAEGVQGAGEGPGGKRQLPPSRERKRGAGAGVR